MKKLLKWSVIIFIVLVVIGAFSGNKKDSTIKQEEQKPATQIKDAFNQGSDKARQVLNQKEETKSSSKIFEYSNEMVKISEQLSEIMNRRATLLEKWPNMEDIDVIEFVALGIKLERLHDEADLINPPEEMISVHEKMLKGLNLYKQSVPLINDGLDKKDTDLINKSADLLKKGTEYINSASAEIKAYLKQ